MKKKKPPIIETPVLYISPNLAYEEIGEIIGNAFIHIIEAFVFGGHSGILLINSKIALTLHNAKNGSEFTGFEYHNFQEQHNKLYKEYENKGVGIKIDNDLSWSNTTVFFNGIEILIIQSDNILF